MLYSVVLFRLHMKIHARVSSACQACVRQGTSPYRLHTRDRILSSASYSFLYILFTFLAPNGGREYSLHTGVFYQSPQDRLGDWGHRLVLPVNYWSWSSYMSYKTSPTSLRRFAPLVTLVRKSDRLYQVRKWPMSVSPIATDSRIAW